MKNIPVDFDLLHNAIFRHFMEREQVLESKNRLNFKPYNSEEQDILEGLENLPF